jgi:hypothetical protein
MPPPLRNHRTPMFANTPACTAAVRSTPLERSPPRTGRDAPFAPQAHVRPNALPLQQHDPALGCFSP